MKVLVITNLFPNSQEPTRGIFNFQQCLSLSKLCEIKVIAPLPWSPFARLFKRGAAFAKVPDHEVINGIEVYHPRYFMIPKVGRSLYGVYLFLSLYRKVKFIQKVFNFDVAYVPWVYPDGVACQWICSRLKKPIIIAALGSDINMYLRYYFRRSMIVRALNHADGVVAVSNSLKSKMVMCGVSQKLVNVIPNGVNDALFNVKDKLKCRVTLGLDPASKIILFAGNLVPVKGIQYLIDAFLALQENVAGMKLVIVGDGPLKNELISSSRKIGNSIVFVGRQPHHLMPLWMNACDIFCLPSINEGCPNVLLEAMACGAYIVASNVGGIPDIVDSDATGILVPPGEAGLLRQALERALSKVVSKNNTRATVTQNWDDNALQLYSIFQTVNIKSV